MKFSISLSLLASGSLFAGESAPVSSAKSGLDEYSAKGAKEIILPPAKVPSRWQVRGGLMWRRLGETTVDPNLRNGQNSGDFLRLPTGVGPRDSFGDRAYDDGFVNIGAGTAAEGLTSNWGYQNGGQVSGDNLVYLKSGGMEFDFPTSGREGDETAIAPYLELAYLKPVRERVEAGFVLNFSFTGVDSSITNPITEYSVTTRDTFALRGVLPPEAPFNGSFDGPGPLIDNIPINREQLRTAVGTGRYLFENDLDLFSLALGGEISWKATEKFYLSAGAGIVLNYVDWDASFSIPTALGTLSGRNSGENFLFGAYLKTAAGYQFNEQWGVESFLRYDWNENLTGSVVSSDFEVDLSGWSLGAGVTYRF